MHRILAAFVSLGLAAAANAEVILIDPRATYLRTSQDSLALTPVAISLEARGIRPGDLVRIEEVGTYAYSGNPNLLATDLIGVFSFSNTVLSGTNARRISGAIDAGVDRVTPRTFFGNMLTDIPEDFDARNAELRVPEGARYLFVSSVDSLFGDNSTPHHDYGVRISRVPTPGSSVLAATGMGLMAARRRRRA